MTTAVSGQDVQAPQASHTMLTVLNDPARSAMYGFLAGQAGVKVVQAEGALHALTQLERTRVDAIICDAMMPDMTGAEFISVIEGDAQSKNLPVYLVPQPGDPSQQQRFVAVTTGPEILVRAFHKLGVNSALYPIPLNSASRPQLNGSLAPFALAEFLNWVAELGFNGHWLVTVKPQGGGSLTGHLAMNAGQVVYAEFAGRSGKAALLTLMRNIELHPKTDFQFFQSETSSPGDLEEFKQSTARLLIELAVDLDEASIAPAVPVATVKSA